MKGNDIKLEISCGVCWGAIMIEATQFCVRIRKKKKKNRNVLGKESQKETEQHKKLSA